MRNSILSSPLLPLLSLSLLSSLAPTASATSLVLHLAAASNLPQPQTLPPSTCATLTTFNSTLTALLSKKNSFTFPAIPAGSYLLDIYARDLTFAPLRVDVTAEPVEEIRHGWEDGELEIWQTFRGNEWDNKGESMDKGRGEVQVVVVAAGGRNFWEERAGFSPMSLLSNPMILMGVVGMAVMFGMPKLLENMDPEMREEFEKQQKSSPIAGSLTSGNPMGGFDMAAWMAGSGRSNGGEETTQSTGAETQGGGGGGGGGKVRRRG